MKTFCFPPWCLLQPTPLQFSCLENPMGGGALWAAVHEVAKSRTWLSNFSFTFHFPALEKEMATHSSVLAWRIPGTGEPSLGSHRVGHDWSDLAAAADMLKKEDIDLFVSGRAGFKPSAGLWVKQTFPTTLGFFFPFCDFSNYYPRNYTVTIKMGKLCDYFE